MLSLSAARCPDREAWASGPSRGAGAVQHIADLLIDAMESALRGADVTANLAVSCTRESSVRPSWRSGVAQTPAEGRSTNRVGVPEAAFRDEGGGVHAPQDRP